MVVTAAAVGTGCNELLDVEVPGQVIADELDNPGMADLLVHSAVTDFECAFDGYVVATAVHGDEFADAQFFYGGYWGVDRRTTDDTGPLHSSTCDTGLGHEAFPGIYSPLQVARFQGDDVARRLEGWTDAQVANRDSLIATVYAYAGYAVLFLGESYCSIALDVGPELTPAAAFAEAEARFTTALSMAQSAGATEIQNMALLGRARARLNLAVVDNQVVNDAKLAEAAADAQEVPSGFVKYATSGDNVPRRYNSVFYASTQQTYFTVEEDFRDLTYQAVPDPRVAVINTGTTGFDQVTPLWLQTKYTSLSDPVPIARYEEAQLIIAEAQGGATAVGIINALHAAAGLPAFPGGTAAEIQQHLIQERSRELFLEGHHLGDKLRYNLPFTPPAGTPYPPKAGGSYGDTRCLPLPATEKGNNPNIG
jgi:hypothetical protein